MGFVHYSIKNNRFVHEKEFSKGHESCLA